MCDAFLEMSHTEHSYTPTQKNPHTVISSDAHSSAPFLVQIVPGYKTAD